MRTKRQWKSKWLLRFNNSGKECDSFVWLCLDACFLWGLVVGFMVLNMGLALAGSLELLHLQMGFRQRDSGETGPCWAMNMWIFLQKCYKHEITHRRSCWYYDFSVLLQSYVYVDDLVSKYVYAFFFGHRTTSDKSGFWPEIKEDFHLLEVNW